MARPATVMTVEEYLALPPEPGVRVEWVNGQAYAMSGGRPRHSLVSMNVGRAIANRLGDSPCVALTSDQRIYVRETEAYFFPDVSVVCPPWDTLPGDVQSVANPVLLVEVLSPSTASHDRDSKQRHYRRIPSLRDYLIVDPDERHVTLYTRSGEGWLLRDIQDGSVVISHLSLELPLAEIFAKLEHVPDL